MTGLRKSETIKQLRSRKTKVEAEIKSLKSDLNDINSRLSNRKKLLKDIQGKINAANTEPTVSEHAVLRYLERQYGFDVENVKKQILSDSLRGIIAQLGSGKYPIGEGRTVVVKNKCVVSVL